MYFGLILLNNIHLNSQQPAENGEKTSYQEITKSLIIKDLVFVHVSQLFAQLNGFFPHLHGGRREAGGGRRAQAK